MTAAADWIRRLASVHALLPMRPADATDRLERSTTVSRFAGLASVLQAASDFVRGTFWLLFRAARTPQ